jgi:hypothetical protein
LPHRTIAIYEQLNPALVKDLMKTAWIVFGLVISARGLADTKFRPFDLETKGDKVCKVGRYYSQPICFDKIAKGLGLAIPSTINITDRVRTLDAYISQGSDIRNLNREELQLAGGALFIKPEDRKIVSENFRELSVRNIGVDMRYAVVAKHFTRIPFVASVRWKGRLGMEGTLQVEGFLDHHELKIDQSATLESLNEVMAKAFDIRSFNDSSTEQRIESLRVLESIARRVHFVTVNGVRTDVDEDTLRLLKHVVGPVVYGESIVVIVQEVAEKVANGLSKL